jgi:hypothetical protein
MSVAEVKQMERDHFIDIEDIVSDELMGKLLEHYRDLGHLYDQEGIQI